MPAAIGIVCVQDVIRNTALWADTIHPYKFPDRSLVDVLFGIALGGRIQSAPTNWDRLLVAWKGISYNIVISGIFVLGAVAPVLRRFAVLLREQAKLRKVWMLSPFSHSKHLILHGC